MLSGIDLVDSLVSNYPPELQQQLEYDIRRLLQRDRTYLNSQVQMLLSNYHCCNVFQALGTDLQEFFDLRRQIDSALLEKIPSNSGDLGIHGHNDAENLSRL